jgi:hypothetical protein
MGSAAAAAGVVADAHNQNPKKAATYLRNRSIAGDPFDSIPGVS